MIVITEYISVFNLDDDSEKVDKSGTYVTHSETTSPIITEVHNFESYEGFCAWASSADIASGIVVGERHVSVATEWPEGCGVDAYQFGENDYLVDENDAESIEALRRYLASERVKTTTLRLDPLSSTSLQSILDFFADCVISKATLPVGELLSQISDAVGGSSHLRYETGLNEYLYVVPIGRQDERTEYAGLFIASDVMTRFTWGSCSPIMTSEHAEDSVAVFAEMAQMFLDEEEGE
jgi:hypothetical protein